MFDILGNGHPIQVAWTEANSGNAFLTLDRNRSGGPLNGKDLFGNATEQGKNPEYCGTDDPNGYCALSVFDQPDHGGNGDGIIDTRDEVFSHLRLWIDENHDGISQPNELHTLPELGVYSIALRYRYDPRTDQFGNHFLYQGILNPDPADGTSRDGRYTYDIYFETMAGSKTWKLVEALK